MNDISLIIPFYNGSAYFDLAMQSALAQSVPFAEIIVVNDGSRAEERAFIEQRATQYGFRLITTENGGQGHARNLAAKVATSRWLGFLDQDDLLLPEHNRILLEHLHKMPPATAGWAFGDFRIIQSEGLIISAPCFPFAADPVPSSLAGMLARDLHMAPTSLLLSREAFIAAGGFDSQFKGYEDDDLMVRVFNAGYRGAYVGEVVFLWRSHQAQTTRSAEFMYSMERFVRKWRNHGASPADRRAARVALYSRVNHSFRFFYERPEMRQQWPLLRNIVVRQLFRSFLGGHLSLLTQLAREHVFNRKSLRRLLWPY